MAIERSNDLLRPQPELFPAPYTAMFYTKNATEMTALSTALRIRQLTGGKQETNDLEKEEKNSRVDILDRNAAHVFELQMNKAPFITNAIDSEGAKEAQAEKLGINLPLAIGTYGKGEQKIDMVSDVIEGTTAAAHGRPNAVSVAGIASYRSITPIPEYDGKKINYMQKLFTPFALNGVMDIERPTDENLHLAARYAMVKPEDITVVVMDPKTRPANKSIAEKAQEFGAKVKLIEAGDLAWCLRAINSKVEKPIIVMGRGGAEEGSIAMVAAHARGADCQMREVLSPFKDTDLEKVHGTNVWTAKEFIKGKQEQSMVIFSAITENTHFNIRPVRQTGRMGNYFVDSLTIDYEGFHSPKTNVIKIA